MKKSIQIISLVGAGAAALLLYHVLTPKSKTTTTMAQNTKLPRGYRNNNPLNIRFNDYNDWKGKVLPNTDGAFEQFVSMAYGYRAAIYQIKKYIERGKDTISEIISTWAPSNENNTAGYISTVCSITGYTPATVIDTKDKMINLVYAMAIVENGRTILPNRDEIIQGWNLL